VLTTLALLALSCPLLRPVPQAPDDTSSRIAQTLGLGDPFDDDSANANLVAATGAVEAAIRAAASAPEQKGNPEPQVRARALRLVLQWDLCDRVRAAGGRFDLAAWLALDELDQRPPSRARTALLARAFATAAARDERLRALAAARTVADQFCRDWNEISVSGDEAVTRKYAALESALRGAGAAAAPGLFAILCVPPDVAFGHTDPHPGPDPSMRQQVRALYALGMLGLGAAAPAFALHAGGPSFTANVTAQSFLEKLDGVTLGPKDDLEKRSRAVAAWWADHRKEHAVVLDHLVRGTLRWTRAALAADDQQRRMAWKRGPAALERLVGTDLRCDAGDSTIDLRARVDALEEAWLAKRTHR
jgi:hypothetical protein